MNRLIIVCFFIALISINPTFASTNDNSTEAPASTPSKKASKPKVVPDAPTKEELTAPTENQNQTVVSSSEIQSNTTDNSTSVDLSVDIRMKDAFLVEIDYLKEQIDLNKKKIDLIERLRTNYLENNQTIPTISLDLLENSINIDSYGFPNPFAQQYSPYVNSILRERISDEVVRERGESNIMNKIFKRYSHELPYRVKQMVYLPTKSMQRVADEPALAALLVLLTSTNEIILYSLNGIFLSSFNPGHTVKSIGVNSFTDEYFVLTLGTDNTVRVHIIAMNRVKHETQTGADIPGKKSDRFKYVLEYNNTLEYIYDLEEHKIISQQEADERAPTRKERGWKSVTSILGRSMKFLALGDENGDLVILNRNGTYKGKFSFPDSKFISIQKHYPHPIYTTDKAVGFFNPNMMEIANPRCDLAGENIIKVELDQFATNEFFALLQNGDILFYEIKQGSTHCKAVAKRSVPTRTNNPQGLDLFGAKSFLFMREDKRTPHLFAHNITDVIYASVQDIEYHNVSFYPYSTDIENVVKSDYLSVRTSSTSSFISAYFEFKNGTSVITMYELNLPVKAASDWFSNFRMPIVFVAVLLAIGYQFWNRRKKRDDQEAMETLSKLGLSGESFGKNFGKGSKDLGSLKDSLDSLTKQTNRMSEDLDSMVSGAYQKIGAGLKKAGGGGYGDDDDLQEISTKKFR